MHKHKSHSRTISKSSNNQELTSRNDIKSKLEESGVQSKEESKYSFIEEPKQPKELIIIDVGTEFKEQEYAQQEYAQQDINIIRTDSEHRIVLVDDGMKCGRVNEMQYMTFDISYNMSSKVNKESYKNALNEIPEEIKNIQDNLCSMKNQMQMVEEVKINLKNIEDLSKVQMTK